METTRRKVLLVSGTGFLGSCLARGIPGADVVPTTRATLDLEKPVARQLPGLLAREGFTHVVLCAAMADVDRCRREPELSRRVNVDGPLELLGACAGRGIAPVFFSTDLVFSGEEDLRREDDPVGPPSLYGRQKAVLERFVRERHPEHLVFRVSKLMSMAHHPRNILTPLLRGEGELRLFRDQWITPVFVEDVARALGAALGRGLRGTYHLAGPERLTRLELGRLACPDPGRIREIGLADVAWDEPRGPFNTLCSARFARDAAFVFTPLVEGLAKLRAAV